MRGNTSSGPDAGGWREAMREAAPYLGLGMQLALAMVFFTGIGYLLDRWLGLMPWLTVAGAVVGMGAVFVQLVRVSNEAARRSKARRRPPEQTQAPGEP